MPTVATAAQLAQHATADDLPAAVIEAVIARLASLGYTITETATSSSAGATAAAAVTRHTVPGSLGVTIVRATVSGTVYAWLEARDASTGAITRLSLE